MPDLARRVATAAALLAVLLTCLFTLPRDAVLLLAALIAGEWARLCGLAGRAAGMYAGGVVLALLLLSLVDAGPEATFVGAAVFWIFAAPLWMASGVEAGHRKALAVAGFVALVPAGLAIAALRPLEALATLMVAWIADTAAYFVGRRWGRRKLAPSISPGKTWEGAAGGLIAVLAYAMILSIFVAGAQMPVLLGVAVLLALVSIVGDLFESAAKRQAGVKDSGALLPGHGGVLDRIDSALATLPLAALLALFLR